MALHDYCCSHCGQVAVDVFRSVAQGATSDPPHCCDLPMEWIPGIGAVDALEPGQEFLVYDGRNRPVLVESLAQIRKIEKESEQQARDGVGQQMVWRKYSQDRSNTQVQTLGADPTQGPSKAAQRKFGLRKFASEPSVQLGPGVTDATTSALKESHG